MHLCTRTTQCTLFYIFIIFLLVDNQFLTFYTKIKCAVLVTNVGLDLIVDSESAHKKIRNSVGVEGRGGGSKCQIYLLSALVGGIPQLSASIVRMSGRVFVV